MSLRKSKSGYLLILLFVHLQILRSLQFTAWPEMFSYPYLRNYGYLMNVDFIHPYPPVLTMVLATLYSIFGYGLPVLKTFTWLLILVNDLLIYLLIKTISKGELKAVFGVLIYMLVQPFLEGNMLWFDLAIVPWILLGTLFTICTFQQTIFKSRRWFGYLLAGLAFGIASLIKQTAGLFVLVGFFWLVYKKVGIKNLTHYLAGSMVLWVIVLIRLATEGAFSGFINWVFVYPLTFWGKFPGYVDMGLTGSELFVLTLLLTPAVIAFFKYRKTLSKNNLGVLFLMLIAGLISVYPRFSYFHLQLVIALIAVFAGLLINKKTLLVFFLLVALFFKSVAPTIAFNWEGNDRFYGRADLSLAKTIEVKTKGAKNIYLLGLHSGLYVFTNTLPPKPWTDNFGWYLEAPGVQDWVIDGWNAYPPEYVVVADRQPGNSYDLGTYRPSEILDWLESNYKKEGQIADGIQIWSQK